MQDTPALSDRHCSLLCFAIVAFISAIVSVLGYSDCRWYNTRCINPDFPYYKAKQDSWESPLERFCCKTPWKDDFTSCSKDIDYSMPCDSLSNWMLSIIITSSIAIGSLILFFILLCCIHIIKRSRTAPEYENVQMNDVKVENKTKDIVYIQ